MNLKKILLCRLFITFCLAGATADTTMYYLGQISTREDNQLLAELILSSTAMDSQALISGICQRDDFHLNELIIYLSVPHKNQIRNEHYLRLILYAFSKENDTNLTQSRVKENSASLQYMLQNMNLIQNPLLKSELFKLSIYLPGELNLTCALEELHRILNNTKKFNRKTGLIPEETSLIESMLPLIVLYGEKLFISPLGRLLPFVGNKRISSEIKKTITILVESDIIKKNTN